MLDNEAQSNEVTGAQFTALVSGVVAETLKSLITTPQFVEGTYEKSIVEQMLAKDIENAIQNYMENETQIQEMIDSSIDSSCSYGKIDQAIDRALDNAIDNIDWQDHFNDCDFSDEYVSRETFDELNDTVENLKAQLVAVQAVYSALVIIKDNLQN